MLTSAHQTGQKDTGISSHPTVHFTPPEQAGDTVASTANFNGWHIAYLPAIPLVKIASYLSENDCNNLAKTCVKVRENMIISGIIEHPTISITPWLTVELNRKYFSHLYTFGQPDRLMRYYPLDQLLRIWAPKEDGIWHREAAIPGTRNYFYHDDRLFIPWPVSDTGGVLLFVFQRNDHGVWSKIQQLTYNEIYHLPDSQIHNLTPFRSIFNITLSPDNRSMACLVTSDRVALLGQGVDGRWQYRGQSEYATKVLFSPDSRHIALTFTVNTCFMSKSDNGLWVLTGRIHSDHCHSNMEFSPDSRHFVTCFSERRSDSEYTESNLLYLILVGLNQQSKWSEKMRTNKVSQWGVMTRFSPDGSHLVVGTDTGFEVWARNDEDMWELSYITSDRDRGYWMPHKSSVIKFISSFEFMLPGTHGTSLWKKNPSGSWSNSLIFPYTFGATPLVSPDGNAICISKWPANAELWARRDEWKKMTIDHIVNKAFFNDDSSLLAMICDKHLIIFGKSTSGCWREKCQLTVGGDVTSFSFSKCSRTITVHYKCRTGRTRLFMTHLRITQNND